MHFVFEVHVKPGYRAEQYAQAWLRASEHIQRAAGARGTRLHRKIGDPSVLLAIATWESKAARDAMESHLPEAARAIIAAEAEFVDVRLIGEFEEPDWEVLPAHLGRPERAAAVEAPIHPDLRARWSPYAFDPDRPVRPADLRALFEAARWSMSSFNAQPWRYIVGVRARDETLWRQVLGVLVEGNRAWAQYAPVLAIGVLERRFEHNGKENKAAFHDLGAASAALTFEATARGLHVHQMIGIEPENARSVFALTESQEALTAIAIGYLGDGHALEPRLLERDRRERTRKPIDEIVIRGDL
jgi:nitroreductase